ncbi:MAG: NADH-quinone oxidoreductase subunit B, partial [Peptococcaceae bacterium]|nr:NADH-quinone oxidoreductase subunit B [Peptococcaceae bacterium]
MEVDKEKELREAEEMVKKNIILTTVDTALNWARGYRK